MMAPASASCCCLRGCRCPVFLDLVWERVRSRAATVTAALAIVTQSLVLPLFTQTFSPSSCRGVYRSLVCNDDATCANTVSMGDSLTDEQAVALRALLTVIGLPLALLANSEYESTWWCIVGAVAMSLAAFTELVIEAQFCVRAAVTDEAGRRQAPGSFASVAGLPVLMFDIVYVAAWAVNTILAVQTVRVCIHEWTATRSCTRRPRMLPTSSNLALLPSKDVSVNPLRALEEPLTPAAPHTHTHAPLAAQASVQPSPLPDGMSSSLAALHGARVAALPQAEVDCARTNARTHTHAHTRAAATTCCPACMLRGTSWLLARAHSSYLSACVVLSVVPLRVVIACTLACVCVCVCTVLTIVLPIVFVPRVVTLIENAFAQPGTGTTRVVALTSGVAARLLARARPLLGDDFDWVKTLPSTVTQAGIAAGIIAAVVCAIVLVLTLNVYYAINTDYLAAGRDASEPPEGDAQDADDRLSVEAIRTMRESTSYAFGKQVAQAMAGDFRAQAMRASMRHVGGHPRGLSRTQSAPMPKSDEVPVLSPLLLRAVSDGASPGAERLPAASRRDRVVTMTSAGTTLTGMPAASSEPYVAPVESGMSAPGIAAIREGEHTPARVTARTWREWLCSWCACRREEEDVDAVNTPQVEKSAPDRLRAFSFSAVFSYIPFFVINILVTYALVWVTALGIIITATLPPLRSAVLAGLYTLILSTLIPLIIRDILLGRILADGTRIKMPRLFMLVDAFYTFTVGAVYGFASALLRLLLVLTFSVLRSTQLPAPMLPHAWAHMDPGFATHAAVLKCRFAAGPHPSGVGAA